MIAKQSVGCGVAAWLRIAALGIATLEMAALVIGVCPGVCAPGASAEDLRMSVQAGNEQLASGDAKQDQGQDKDKKDEKKDDKKDDKKDEKKGLPLKADHKITFNTDEGTWLSLDVSRGGRDGSANHQVQADANDAAQGTT